MSEAEKQPVEMIFNLKTNWVAIYTVVKGKTFGRFVGRFRITDDQWGLKAANKMRQMFGEWEVVNIENLEN